MAKWPNLKIIRVLVPPEVLYNHICVSCHECLQQSRFWVPGCDPCLPAVCDHLSWATIFAWPTGWSLYAGFTVPLYTVDFKAPGKLWNPLSKTVLSKCSFIWSKWPIMLKSVVGPVNIFPNFLPALWCICPEGSSYSVPLLLTKTPLILDMLGYFLIQIDGLVQERRNSIANALELYLSCTNPSKCS